MTTATIAQAGAGDGPPTSSGASLIVNNSNNNNGGSNNNNDNENNSEENENASNNSNNNNNSSQHLLPQHMTFNDEEEESLRQHQLHQQHQQQLLANIDDQDEGRRYNRGGVYMHPHQQQGLHPHHNPHPHHPHLHHHPAQLHPSFEQLDRDYHRPVDLGYVRSPYSPGNGNGSAAAVAAAAAAAAVGGEWSGGHQLVPGQGWMDEGGRGGLLWTTEQQSQYHRYQVSSMKWEPSGRPSSVGGLSSKSKLCSPGSSGLQGLPNDLIPDETLALLSVKELNKRVQAQIL